MSEICPNCGGLINLRNPTGQCDHLHYPENVCPDPRPAQGPFILCYVNESTISPEGDGKSYGYAKDLLNFYRAQGRRGFRMFKLVPVDGEHAS